MGEVTIATFIGALLLVCAPLFISEMIGGWVRKHTSPAKFRATDVPNPSGKAAAVTGANAGIGCVTALELAQNGAQAIVAALNPSQGQTAVKNIKKSLGDDAKVRFMQLDLASPSSVQNFVQEFESLDLPLHLLVNNAGTMMSPGVQFAGQNFTCSYDLTQDGFESHIGVNHIGHAHLTHLLADKLKLSAPSRVVQVSSMAEEGAHSEGVRFDLWKPTNKTKPHSDCEDGMACGQSKLANLSFAREFAQRMNGTGVMAHSCHPGIILSELSRHLEEEMTE